MAVLAAMPTEAEAVVGSALEAVAEHAWFLVGASFLFTFFRGNTSLPKTRQSTRIC